MSELTAADMDELQLLAEGHRRFLASCRFSEADELRAELMAWGAWPPELGWHPVFESVAHRVERLSP